MNQKEIQIPNGWKKVDDLSDIISLLETGSRPKGGVSQIYDGIPSLGGEHIDKNGKLNLSQMRYVSNEFFESMNKGVIKKYDILMIKDGYTGKTSFIDDTFPFEKASVSEHVYILRPTVEIIPKFLFYYLRSTFSQSIIKKRTKGIIAGLNTTFVKDFPIIFPIDKKIQQKITDKLDYVLDKLNQKQSIIFNTYEKQLNKNKNQKQIFYQSVLNSATFGKFTNNWRKKHPNAKVSDEILKFHNPSLLDSTLSSELPENWAILTLNSISDIRGGVTLGRKLNGDLISMPYLRVANVQDGFLDLQKIKEVKIKTEEREKWLLQKYDILLTEGGDWDKLGRGTLWNDEIPNCIHQNHIFRVRMNFSEINPRFILHVIASTFGKKYFQKSAKQTTNLASINSTQLKAFPVLFPPFDEQEEIVKIVNEKMKSLDILESHIKHYSQLVQNSQKYIQYLSSSIIDSAFAGKLVT